MKKFNKEDLQNALNIIQDNQNPVLSYFSELINEEIELLERGKFVKASKEYLKNLTYNDISFRLLEKTDYGYYPGMYGMFERKTGKLLARHTDLGMLPMLPK